MTTPEPIMETVLAGLRAAGEETRLRLLALCAQGDLTVSDMCRIVGQSQPRISRHLKVLCDTELLDRFREGSWVFYRAARTGTGAALTRHILSLIPPDDAVLSADRARMDQVREERAEAAAAYFRDNAANWDAIRSLHVDEREVERALTSRLGGGRIRHLVDIGTGTGRLLTLLGPQADQATGLDLSREMLAVARAALDSDGLRHCVVRPGDMYAVPLPDASADLVTIHQVLHYADRPAAAIQEAARVLAPGGRLAVIDFAPHDLEDLRTQHNHRRLGFSDAEVTAWCAHAGLTLTSAESLAGHPASGHPLTVVLWLAEKAG